MRSLQISATGPDTDKLSLGVSNLSVSLNADNDQRSVLRLVMDYLFDWLRPYSPNLVSLFVFVFLMPFIAFISFYAGFIVWKSVAVGWQIPLYLQYGDGGSPYAHTLLSDLSPRQPYNVVLQLVVPSAESNLALGNFMNSLTLSTTSNKTLASVRRPAIVPHRYSILKNTPNLVTLQIPMLDSFVPGTRQLAVDVTIGRRDVWKTIGSGQGRELAVSSASLKGILARKGIRGLVTRFPTFFSVLCSAVFFAILFFFLVACLLPSILQSTPAPAPTPAPPTSPDTSSAPADGNEQKPLLDDRSPELPSDSESDVSNRPSKSARRRKRRSKYKDTSEVNSIKSESEPILVSAGSAGSATPLRRRRSRQISDMENQYD
ncbi:hypothetical protein D9757_005402 [Collybiopsis confluens]|uniref:Adipose-regulatory protein n=1 Tax=Collybiopsis confluens TaxID=2823264 RepID=A0A8H5M956_9AGAR|nr:hypothetical protein D9757_005402 [Collybiopsis confluens]